MADDLKTIKFQLMLSPSEAETIDDWGFKNRIRTRAEAIRRLCQIAMVFDEYRPELFAAAKNNVVKAGLAAGEVNRLIARNLLPGDASELAMATLETAKAAYTNWDMVRTATDRTLSGNASDPDEDLRQAKVVEEIVAMTTVLGDGDK